MLRHTATMKALADPTPPIPDSETLEEVFSISLILSKVSLRFTNSRSRSKGTINTAGVVFGKPSGVRYQ